MRMRVFSQIKNKSIFPKYDYETEIAVSRSKKNLCGKKIVSRILNYLLNLGNVA